MNCFRSDLPLLRRLRKALSGRDLGWCLQGTDGAPERPGGGPNRLDLLVRRADAQRFIEILQHLGFKEARPVASRKRPGVVHYYGYDGLADRIVHVSASFHPEIGNGAAVNPRARIEDAGERRRMGLVSGGALIALVGADGAGKSTALDALYLWLSPHFRVVKIHMGKPRWSWSTFPLKGLLKLGRLLGPLRGGISPASPASPEQRARFGWLVWQAVTARDRYRAYRRARRLAARGALVLCDRFPLSEIQSMDGRRASRLPAASRRWPAGLLLGLQERYYAAIAQPDLLLVLSLSPDAALRRRPEDPEDRVRQRAREVLEVDWAAAGAHVLDAERSMSEVHRELKSWIWTRL